MKSPERLEKFFFFCLLLASTLFGFRITADYQQSGQAVRPKIDRQIASIPQDITLSAATQEGIVETLYIPCDGWVPESKKPESHAKNLTLTTSAAKIRLKFAKTCQQRRIVHIENQDTKYTATVFNGGTQERIQSTDYIPVKGGLNKFRIATESIGRLNQKQNRPDSILYIQKN